METGDSVDKTRSQMLKALTSSKVTDYEEDEDDNNVLHLCDNCPFQTDILKEFLEHVIENRTHHNLHCLLCSKSFRQKVQLKSHYKNSHNSTKTLKCDDCRYQALSKENLQSHRFGTHVRTTYSCINCNANFSNSGLFVKHLYSHDNLKLIRTGQKIEKLENGSIAEKTATIIKCNECEYQTDNKNNMGYHNKKHHDITFKCKECPFHGFNKLELVRHNLKIHREEKRRLVPMSQVEWAKIKSGQDTSVAFMCDLCFKVVASLDSLEEHKRTEHFK